MRYRQVLPMGNPATKELLDKYYETVSAKGRLGQFLSEDFSFSGTVGKVAAGRGAFEENLFFKYVKSLEVKTMIIEGGRACALVNYGLVSPKGDALSLDAAEIWQMKDGKLGSLAMYFDTVEYQKFMLPILFPLTKLKKRRI